MALTEQDFQKIIKLHVFSEKDDSSLFGVMDAVEELHNQHIAECERIAELALDDFNIWCEIQDRLEMTFYYRNDAGIENRITLKELLKIYKNAQKHK